MIHQNTFLNQKKKKKNKNKRKEGKMVGTKK